jgi:cytochrome c oxidase assembly protein subunit 15
MSSAADSLSQISAHSGPSQARHLRALRVWLGFVALLIFGMIMVGGATRLTDSGLSITEWKPVTGAVPPLSDAAWQEAFDAYKQIPEYRSLKQGMSLEAFKSIYWWEWGHRFLGRLIGVAFFLPFIAFWATGYIPRPMLPRLAGLFVLGGLQGAVGWYMVKSGLVDRTDVSQYRLAAHLGVAVLIFGYTLWLIFQLGGTGRAERRGFPPVASAGALVLGLVYLQILAGALVAGLDAGLGYNTWPDIDGALIPQGLGTLEPWYFNLFENRLTVQFDHRMLGYTVVLAIILQAIWLAARGKEQPLPASGYLLVMLALLQATLGVWTLLLSVPIGLALAHQAGAMLLFAAALPHLWLALGRPSPIAISQTVASA